jgi:hypothetical protein
LSPKIITEGGQLSPASRAPHRRPPAGDEVAHGPGNVFDRRRIDSVLVPEVDAVSPEAVQHLLDDLADVVGPAVPPSVRELETELVARTTSSRIGSSASPTSVSFT